ncbi:class I SAM-dependent methyltransferase [Sphaerisporangium album]|uniref:Class I SAM-dependent methyltransferase n=1 Tax=Sphaerisporangium album TaxID=509200 RepID=A0A367FLH1_9ACTN|nr:class I SAM-dependent methyltransferase [Sphaerisporangium album]RCG31124.1 class I SAM-dependent methyltransferase [Sphaerisporangium album]
MKDTHTREARTNTQARQMEGRMARWYARQRASAAQLAETREFAARLTGVLPRGADILEVAPGPGYLAVEMARLGYRVSGLDSSHSFVEIASENARKAGADVTFHHGDAAELPFGDETFDLVVCAAAFKNFGRPLDALNEMHRVLRPGATAFINDMNRASSPEDIDEEVRRMGLNAVNSFMTKVPLVWLRRRAYSPALFRRLAAQSAFRTCEIQTEGISLNIVLTKHEE